MKIGIFFNGMLVVEAHEVPNLLRKLSFAPLYTKLGWTDDSKLQLTQEKVKFGFIDESRFVETPEPFTKLQEAAKTADDCWYKQYNECKELEKKVKELEGKLVAITNAVEDPL